MEERYGANIPPAEKGRFFDVSRFRNMKLREGSWLMWSELLNRLVPIQRDHKSEHTTVDGVLYSERELTVCSNCYRGPMRKEIHAERLTALRNHETGPDWVAEMVTGKGDEGS